MDVLVNNAGLSTWGPVAGNDPEGDLTLVRTNVEAVVHLCSLFLPGMVGRRTGAVLNVASTAAFQPLPGQAAYAASKSFVLSYSHAIRAELRGTGVSVTVLCPGPVKTGFTEAAGITDEEAEAPLPKFLWLSGGGGGPGRRGRSRRRPGRGDPRHRQPGLGRCRVARPPGADHAPVWRRGTPP